MANRDLPKSYSAPPSPGNPRLTEAWALTQAALRMKAAQEAGDTERMLTAGRLNWRLWTILQSELLDPQSPVPADVRNNVLSLARFVDRRTLDFLSAPAKDKLTALISINRELAGGLYATPTTAGPESGRIVAATAPSDVESNAAPQRTRISI